MSFVDVGIPYFVDPVKGKPVSNGFLYIGEPDTDPTVVVNQKEVVLQQEDGTSVATSQPVQLGAGGVAMYNGSPVQVIVDGDYSLTVKDRFGAQVYYISSAVRNSVIIDGSGFLLSDLEATEGATDGMQVNTTGRSSYGDGGGGIFVWDSSDFSAREVLADTYQGIYVAPLSDPTGASGAWVRQYDGDINALWFGAVGDSDWSVAGSGQDNYQQLQCAIDMATYIEYAQLFIPSGQYRITKTLHFGYGADGGVVSAPAYSAPRIYGDGSKFRSIDAVQGTSIVANFYDAPAVNIQASRGGTLKGISIVGGMLSYLKDNRMGAWGPTPDLLPVLDDLDIANWNGDPNLPASALTDTAPYVGISTDAYGIPTALVPAVTYPTVTYPDFIGTQVQYDKLGTSSGFEFHDVWIGGFMGAFTTYPCGGDGQSEHFNFYKCHFEFNTYGVVINNTQARTLTFHGTRIESSYACLATGIWGAKDGKPSFSLFGCELDFCINWIKARSVLTGPTIFSGCYGEIVYRIGDFDSTGAQEAGAITFDTCTWLLVKQESAGSPESLFGGNTPATFRNCTLTGFSGFNHFEAPVNIEGGLISISEPLAGYNKVNNTDYLVTPWYAIRSLYALGFITRSDPTKPWLPEGSYVSTQATDINGDIISALNRYPQKGGYFGRSSSILSYEASESLGAYAQGINNPCQGRSYLVSAGGYTISNSGRVFTITLTGGSIPATDDLYTEYGLEPQDIIISSPPTSSISDSVFIITNRVGNVLTAILQNGFDGSEVPIQTITNSSILYFHGMRFYAPTLKQIGTFTAGSSVITDVHAPNGVMYDTDLRVGDKFISGDWYQDELGATGGRITDIDTNAKTITLNAVALATVTKPLDVLIKKPIYTSFDTEFTDATSDVNTTDKALYSQVWDTTTDAMVFAAGEIANAPWLDAIGGSIVYLPLPALSQTDFEDITSAVNTTGKNLGTAIWDSTSSGLVYATGSSSGASWNTAASGGTIVYSPVASSAIFTDITDVINTTGKLINLEVWDSTTAAFVYASKDVHTAPWLNAIGGAVVYVPAPANTSANFLDATDPINTTGKALLVFVWDTTSNQFLYANGPLTTDVWRRESDGAPLYTPV